MTQDIFILSGVRTPIGTFGGALADIPPTTLAATVAGEAIRRAGIEPTQVGLSVFGNVIHTEPRDMYFARVAALGAGVSETAPALTVNRLCGSGLQAVVSGFEAICLGHADITLTGGGESMSRTGHLMTSSRAGTNMGDVTATDMLLGSLTDPFGYGHMGITAENVADRHQITREAQDAYAMESHQRAAAAIEAGYFRDQILPIEVRKGRKEFTFDTDEHVRKDTTIDGLATLRPVFRKDGTVTAGNASGINDAAAALILAGADAARASGTQPLARIVATGLGGVAPEVMGLGPVPAVHQVLQRAGLTLTDIDVIESNEAFAAQACGVAQELGFDPDKTNPNGGAIGLGHPVGASGAIILIKLIHELRRISGRYGLATMCIGGGQGIAVIVEAVHG